MNISVIQPDTIWEDKLNNLLRLSELLEPLRNVTDIVVLPEMFNTGFSMNVENLCEVPNGDTFLWMKRQAVKGNFGICGSYIVIENGNFYNRWLFVSPENKTFQYDKRHLFSMGGEDIVFTKGTSKLVFTFRNITISPFICYDLRFPVWSRNNGLTDLMIYSANWPEARHNVWLTLLRARAIENQCYVAGSNRTGKDGQGILYNGDSMIIDPRGEIIASAYSVPDSSATYDVSVSELNAFRKKFPVHNDADDFILNIG